MDSVCLWVESVGGGVSGCSLCVGAVTTHHNVKKAKGHRGFIRDHPVLFKGG